MKTYQRLSKLPLPEGKDLGAEYFQRLFHCLALPLIRDSVPALSLHSSASPDVAPVDPSAIYNPKYLELLACNSNL